jgi:sugar phosphate isomerase/epimerase
MPAFAERHIVQIGGRAHSLKDVRQIAEAGLSFAEISIVNPAAFCRDELDELRHIRDRYGLYYLVHGPEEGDAWNPQALRMHLLPCIRSVVDCTRALGAHLVTIHFWLDARFIDQVIIEKKVPLLQEMAGYASGRGLQLCLENLSEQPDDLIPVFDAIDSLGMTLDIGHAQLLAVVNQSHGFVRRCRDRIRHVHVHDNRGGDHPSDDLHLPLGEGTIDFAAILGDLKQYGYDHTITLEVAPDHLRHGKAIINRIWNAGGAVAPQRLP